MPTARCGQLGGRARERARRVHGRRSGRRRALDRTASSGRRDVAGDRGGAAGRIGRSAARHLPRRRAARRLRAEACSRSASCYEGRLTNGAYDWPGVRNVTAVYQDPAVPRELRARHGRDLRFAGIVLAPGYLDGAEQKRRAAEASAELVAGLGADGVVCTTFSSGNSHTDTMLTVQACERRGIGAVALVCETNGGLTDHVPEADCLVSTGNEDELVDAWTPATGDRWRGSRARGRARARRCTTSAGSCRPATRDGRRCRHERRRALPEPVLRRPRRRGSGRPRARAARGSAGTGPGSRRRRA